MPHLSSLPPAVADDSTKTPVKVTLWTSACVQMYTSIQLEDIVYIDNYKIGKLFKW